MLLLNFALLWLVVYTPGVFVTLLCEFCYRFVFIKQAKVWHLWDTLSLLAPVPLCFAVSIILSRSPRTLTSNLMPARCGMLWGLSLLLRYLFARWIKPQKLCSLISFIALTLLMLLAAIFSPGVQSE